MNRLVLLLATAASLFVSSCTSPSGHGAPAQKPVELSADAALARLKRGNDRFSHGHLKHPDQSVRRIHEVSAGQHPFAAVVACADSRVPPEIVFDEGLGDLFVVREAGHVADDATLGSLEYAVHHLGVPLIVVLGHEDCGAVGAAVEALEKHQRGEGHISALVKDIAPAVVQARHRHGGSLVHRAVASNVDLVVDQLSTSHPFLAEAIEDHHLKIVGAVYHLEDGTVSWR